MITAFIRKGRQVLGDPVLRRWLVGRVVGHNAPPPDFDVHHPPYLAGTPPLAAETPTACFPEIPASAPRKTIDLALAGETVHADENLFERDFADIETLLSLHRFAWLTMADFHDPDTAAWLNVLWRRWREKHGSPGEGWSWHPYTAAERAINLLDFAVRHGLPGPIGDTSSVLAAHAPAIARRLEYFGEHNTSNHLANNGRGLYRIGLALGLPRATDMGMRILTEEAKRIFAPSGVLREGSTHYHALLTKQYLSCLEATGDRPEAAAFAAVAQRGLAALKGLSLPGGLPLIGDISPDCTPEWLAAYLEPHLRNAVSCPHDTLVSDGWLRAFFGPWSGLWHADPKGWSPMPGHGHQDCGGFQLHFGDEPIFVDRGRGSYNRPGETDPDVRAGAHNSLTVDNNDPFAPNKPYYDDAFRRHVGGPAPYLGATDEGVMLRHKGFSRLRGVGAHIRDWRFNGSQLVLSDTLEGAGTHLLTRRLHTPLPIDIDGETLVLRGRSVTLRIHADGPLHVRASRCWTAYGRSTPANMIECSMRVRLPYSGILRVEAA